MNINNFVGNLVVILAGYKDRMDTFFQSNPGMNSRIAHHIEFPDYALDELSYIAEKMLTQQHYSMDSGANAAFQSGDALLEHRGGGVADAAVHMASAFQVKKSCRLVRRLKHIRGG